MASYDRTKAAVFPLYTAHSLAPFSFQHILLITTNTHTPTRTQIAIVPFTHTLFLLPLIWCYPLFIYFILSLFVFFLSSTVLQIFPWASSNSTQGTTLDTTGKTSNSGKIENYSVNGTTKHNCTQFPIPTAPFLRKICTSRNHATSSWWREMMLQCPLMWLTVWM